MITTLLDLLGALLVITGLAWLIAAWVGIAAIGLLVGGGGLLFMSWFIDRPQKARKHKEDRL